MSRTIKLNPQELENVIDGYAITSHIGCLMDVMEAAGKFADESVNDTLNELYPILARAANELSQVAEKTGEKFAEELAEGDEVD